MESRRCPTRHKTAPVTKNYLVENSNGLRVRLPGLESRKGQQLLQPSGQQGGSVSAETHLAAWCEHQGRAERVVRAEAKALRYTCGRGVVADTIPLSQSFLLVQRRHQGAQRLPPRKHFSILCPKKRAVSILQKAARLSTLHLPLTCAAWGKPSNH